MKAFRLILLTAVILCAASCGSIEDYITYDPVELHKEPSVESAVLVKITCSPKPGNNEFDKKANLLYWTGPRNNPVPLTITKKDGEWGYIRVFSTRARQEFKGWLPLNEMLPCGTNWGGEKRETYSAKQNKVMLHKHPRAGAGEQTKFYLAKGDTVQVLSKEGSWLHVHKVTTYKKSDTPELYGWVPVSQMDPIGTFSANSVTAEIREAETGLKAGLPMEVWRSILMTGMIISLLVFVVLFGQARRRFKLMSDLFLKVLVGAALCAAGVWGTENLPVDIMDALLVLTVPLIIYAVMYPLLYSKKIAPKWRNLFAPLAAICAVLVFIPATRHFGAHGVQKAFLGVAVAALAFALWRIWIIYKRIPEDICPYCGYYAVPDEGEEVFDGETKSQRKVTYEGNREISGVDTVTKDVNTGEVISTDHRTLVSQHYVRHVIEITHTKHYHRDRTCTGCGHVWRDTWTTEFVEDKPDPDFKDKTI